MPLFRIIRKTVKSGICWMYTDHATDFTTEESRFDSRQRQTFCVSSRIQIASEPHSVSNPMDTKGSFPGDGARLTTHPHLVPRLRMPGSAHPFLRTHSRCRGQLSFRGIIFTFTRQHKRRISTINCIEIHWIHADIKHRDERAISRLPAPSVDFL
jgi:hypothetical protein